VPAGRLRKGIPLYSKRVGFDVRGYSTGASESPSMRQRPEGRVVRGRSVSCPLFRELSRPVEAFSPRDLHVGLDTMTSQPFTISTQPSKQPLAAGDSNHEGVGPTMMID
jgi:hypothetical protein